MTAERLIELDARRRASLAKIGRPEHTRYLARAEPDGTIIMTPVDLVRATVGEHPAMLAPTTEVRLLDPREVVGQLHDEARRAVGVTVEHDDDPTERRRDW